MPKTRLVMVDKYLVHDLSGNCSPMVNLRRELLQGRACYTPVKAIQAVVYKIPGCRECFGSAPAFRALIQAM